MEKGIPEMWWAGWAADKLTRDKWPASWERSLTLAFRSDWMNQASPGYAKAHELGGKVVVNGSVESPWNLQKQIDAELAQIGRHPANSKGTGTVPDPTEAQRADLKARRQRVRELTQKIAGAA